MDYIGKRVYHQKYGEGIIISLDESSHHISVRFSSDGEKKFIYPKCFELYLTLLDEGAAKQARVDVQKYESEEKKKQVEEHFKAEMDRIKWESQRKQSKKSAFVHPYSSTSEFIGAFKASLIQEISYLKTNGGKHQKVFEGKKVEIKNGRVIYSFESEEELNYPEGTQITIWNQQQNIPGEIECCEDFTVIISTAVYLGEEVPELEFSAEPWRLIQYLINRLNEIEGCPSDLVKQLICDGFKNIDYGNKAITTGQKTAVKMATQQDITFVWGPPGTGKTRTLAYIALEHIRRGNRILMLSYSNVSVDGAILRVDELSKEKKPGVLVRYGYPRSEKLLSHEYLTSYNLTIRNHPDLLKERKSLVEERRKWSRTSARYVEISKRLTEIRNELQLEEKQAVLNARFVATTVSKAIADKTIYEHGFDVVIFDEASMAYIPQIVFSASLARTNFICMGDFRQLPPIVQSSPASILNGDIFLYCGITTAVERKINHKWLCLLDTQHRMHPQIANFASAVMYIDLLKSASNMEKDRREIVASEPIEGAAIGWVDLSGMMSVCTKTADNSRVNPLSAFVSMYYALQADKTNDVGIITPYHAQSRLLHAMARDIESSGLGYKLISCATVHQFQGSEKDVIIYDSVDCYRIPYPGTLLTSTVNDYADRLFNVALTRAKGKFIGVANNAYMENKNLSKNLMFAKLLYMMKKSKYCCRGSSVMELRHRIQNSPMTICTQQEAFEAYLNDIKQAKKEIRVDIPDKLADDYSLKTIVVALKEANKRGVKLYIRAEKKTGLPGIVKTLAVENQFVANPITLIDKRISWFGMPFSSADFISEERTLKTRFRPILRFVGSHTALSLYGFMEMSKTTDQSNYAETDENGELITDNFFNYVLKNVKCPACGKSMKVKKSNKGKFFLACTGYPACNKTSLISPELVNTYLYRHGGTGQHCPKCIYSLEAKLGPYGLYIQCCGFSRHKFKVDEI